MNAEVVNPLIGEAELRSLLGDDARGGGVLLLDVRWSLEHGLEREDYLAGHLPGARLVDLDTDLSAPAGDGGRHPVPSAEAFQSAMRRHGAGNTTPVVVYDAATGTVAARAWWVLRYFGQPDVRLLDGGYAAWVEAGAPVETGPPAEVDGAGDFVAVPGGMPVLSAEDAGALARDGVLVDCRPAPRYRGEEEPRDPVAGHIPGAVNAPTSENLAESGLFRPPDELRERFAHVAGRDVGVYCGSGVTAPHTVLALASLGIPGALFPGSWSEWVRDPSRPVATGDEPTAG
ncbi:MAG: sulfurtransferase [Propionibacteriales bacterium]|nr:sulfurtransferase [Propionibacteriales bacterium]